LSRLACSVVHFAFGHSDWTFQSRIKSTVNDIIYADDVASQVRNDICYVDDIIISDVLDYDRIPLKAAGVSMVNQPQCSVLHLLGQLCSTKDSTRGRVRGTLQIS